ncbi:MAG: 16S rRNA (uracil(1498)-N(3))-methyltransferase [Planctomycetes bacterium]|nr:16S rRNA (uracil(1498)-N(3))-methyltransferase [Planctomycetota bacterium]
MVDRFFIAGRTIGAGSLVELDRDESRHAVDSRRLRVGATVELLDGNGLIARGSVTSASRRGVEVQVTEANQVPRTGRRVALVVSVPRGPRMDTLVDMATQLGAAAICPIAFERSVAARDEVSPNKVERWGRIAREACKQSGAPYLPQIAPLETMEQWCATRPREESAYLLHPSAPPPSLGARLALSVAPVSLVIGPEGGVTDRELAVLEAAGVVPASLPTPILRIETAAVAALALACAVST